MSGSLALYTEACTIVITYAGLSDSFEVKVNAVPQRLQIKY